MKQDRDRKKEINQRQVKQATDIKNTHIHPVEEQEQQHSKTKKKLKW